jgi:hypothetical protein
MWSYAEHRVIKAFLHLDTACKCIAYKPYSFVKFQLYRGIESFVVPIFVIFVTLNVKLPQFVSTTQWVCI